VCLRRLLGEIAARPSLDFSFAFPTGFFFLLDVDVVGHGYTGDVLTSVAVETLVVRLLSANCYCCLGRGTKIYDPLVVQSRGDKEGRSE
jgi:hypothetical protein